MGANLRAAADAETDHVSMLPANYAASAPCGRSGWLMASGPAGPAVCAAFRPDRQQREPWGLEQPWTRAWPALCAPICHAPAGAHHMEHWGVSRRNRGLAGATRADLPDRGSPGLRGLIAGQVSRPGPALQAPLVPTAACSHQGVLPQGGPPT